MFSPFRSPALRARRSAQPPRSPRPPESLGEIEAAVAAAIPLSSAPAPARKSAKAKAKAEGGEAPKHTARFQGGGGGFV